MVSTFPSGMTETTGCISFLPLKIPITVGLAFGCSGGCHAGRKVRLQTTPGVDELRPADGAYRVATTNYQFCAGLKDANVPGLPTPQDKKGIEKFLGDSFQFCSGVIDNLSPDQLSAPHDSPDGRMPGREVLLAMYIHVAHHRGQAEIYLRDVGIRPPGYRI